MSEEKRMYPCDEPEKKTYPCDEPEKKAYPCDEPEEPARRRVLNTFNRIEITESRMDAAFCMSRNTIKCVVRGCIYTRYMI